MIVIFHCFIFFFFKQKTAYEMRISDWSSDVCSSDLRTRTIQPLAETPHRAAILKKLRSRPTVTGSAIALAILMVVVLAAPSFAPQNPSDLDSLNLLDGRLPPGADSMVGQVYLMGPADPGRVLLSPTLLCLVITFSRGSQGVGRAKY